MANQPAENIVRWNAIANGDRLRGPSTLTGRRDQAMTSLLTLSLAPEMTEMINSFHRLRPSPAASASIGSLMLFVIGIQVLSARLRARSTHSGGSTEVGNSASASWRIGPSSAWVP